MTTAKSGKTWLLVVDKRDEMSCLSLRGANRKLDVIRPTNAELVTLLVCMFYLLLCVYE